MVYSGFEIGIALPYPATSIERDYGYVPHHPLAEAYIRRNPPPHNRPTWDLTSVLYAILGDRGYFDLSPPGKVTVEADGFTRFEEASKGNHRLSDPATRAEAARARGPGAALQPAAVPQSKAPNHEADDGFEWNRRSPRAVGQAFQPDAVVGQAFQPDAVVGQAFQPDVVVGQAFQPDVVVGQAFQPDVVEPGKADLQLRRLVLRVHKADSPFDPWVVHWFSCWLPCCSQVAMAMVPLTSPRPRPRSRVVPPGSHGSPW